MAISTLATDGNIIQFYDGNVIFIEEVRYSHDGITHWEDTFNPSTHISTLDGVTEVGPHRYKKVKHSEDSQFQLPMKIIPDEIIFSVIGDTLYWKYEFDEDWKKMYDLANLKGDKGDKGDDGLEGEGIHIDYYGYYYDRPSVGSSSSPEMFLSLGDGKYEISQSEIDNGETDTLDGTNYSYYSDDATTWKAVSVALANQRVQYLATSSSGDNAINLKNKDFEGTAGTIYIFANDIWTPLSSISATNPTVKETSGSATSKYLADFIDGTYVDLVDSYFTITDNSVDTSKIDQIDQANILIGQGDGTDVAVRPVTGDVSMNKDGTVTLNSDYVEQGTVYNNVQINSTNGIVMTGEDGTSYKLYIDGSGNFEITPV